MKILILNDSWPPESMGGADKVAFNLARAIKRRGNEVRVITTTQDKRKEGILEEEGMKVYRIYTKYSERWRAWLSLYNPVAVRRVKKVIRDFKPDVVHAHNIHFYLSYTCLRVAKKSGAKVFLTAHDVMSFSYGKLGTKKYLEEGDGFLSWRDNLRRAKKRYNPLRNILIRYYLSFVDKIIAVSEALKKVLEQNGIKKVMVVHNGIETKEWEVSEEKIEEFKKVRGWEDKKLILFGGRLSEGKGARKVIEAMKVVEKEALQVILLVLGKKDWYAKEIEGLAEKEGVGEKVVMTGWISGETLKEAMGASEVVCVPSAYLDPLPTVVLEAMAAGKPVVGTCWGGTSEMVVDRETGLIVDPRNTEDLAQALLEIITKKERAKKMGIAGKERVRREFDLESKSEEIFSIYKN